MVKEVRIPEISENVTSGKVVAVLVQPGDEVEVNDPLIEFETEKAVVEIPSPFGGRVTEIMAEEGDELKVGDVIAKIDTEDAADREKPAPADRRGGGEAEGRPAAEAAGGEKERPPEKTARRTAEKKDEAAEKDRKEAGGAPPEEDELAEKEGPPEDEARKPRGEADARRGPAPASPSVRRFARELGVDIHAVRPAGPGDRISEADVKAHLRRTRSAAERPPGAAPGGGTGKTPELPDFTRWGEIESRELTGVRRLTAEKMAAAWQTVAHVTQFDRADLTAARAFIDRRAEAVADRGGKLTVTAVLMKVCAAALRRFPHFNASLDMARQKLILKKYVHIGVAVDTPRGLLVPVVRNADRKTILELAVEITDLADRARGKKINPDEMEGGSFTISNQGGIGGTQFTPVVFWPQAAILGVSRASVEPVYIEGELRPRRILPLAMSYDHRIADGADAARFLRWVCESIEQPLTMHFDRAE